GGVSFEHAVRAPMLGAAVVYYGASPAPARLGSVRAPVLGLYGADDARVNATIPPADSAMIEMSKVYRPILYEGAGHGFLRQQDGREGKNLAAARAAWPETVSWFRTYLGR
ncbi:MAG: dienelactone hydrolase family protein, partial [Gemmatimonadaceae bacterium]